VFDSKRAMVGRFTLMAVLALLLATAPVAAQQRAQKGKPPKPGGGGTSSIAATAMMRDGSSDKVTGDGFPYLDGVAGSVRVDGANDFELAPDSGREVYVDASDVVLASPCTGRKCKCGALASQPVALTKLKANIENHDGSGLKLCGMAVGESVSTGRAQAELNGCFVTWNTDPGATPPTQLDGVTITRIGDGEWQIQTNGAATAWMWSDGRRASRQDEGVSRMPFGVTVTATCGS